MKQDKLPNVKHTRICEYCVKEKNVMVCFKHVDNRICNSCIEKTKQEMINISRYDLERLLVTYFIYGKQDMWETTANKAIKMYLDDIFGKKVKKWEN